MAQENLAISAFSRDISFGKDSVVISKYISGIKGGRTLDMTDFDVTGKVLPAGWPIVTDGAGSYKPMPATSATEAGGNVTYALGSMPDGYSYCGVLYRSVLASEPGASIMFNGEVNSEAAPVEYPDDFKSACPQIVFIKGEEA